MTLPPLARCFPPGLGNALEAINWYREAWRNSPSLDPVITANLADWLETAVRAEYSSGVIACSLGLRRGMLFGKQRGRRASTGMRRGIHRRNE
jgi:hypothetical protein